MLRICIFCRCDTAQSVSVEHVIPESLGNSTLILPKGIVCDKCNNYFSRKVEKPFMELPEIRALRFHETLLSKRGRVPSLMGMLPSNYPAKFTYDSKSETTHIDVPPHAMDELQNITKGEFLLPLPSLPPSNMIVSRFLAKVAVECMALRLLHDEEMHKSFIDDPQLNDIRDHARRGTTREWPLSIRQIYAADSKWTDASGNVVQRVHESDFVHTPELEFYFVLGLFGMEMAINIAGPQIDGYLLWLENNDNVSPFYEGKDFSNAEGMNKES